MAMTGRCTGVAAVALVGLCLGLAGCIQTETAYQPSRQPMSPGFPNAMGANSMAPAGNAMAGPNMGNPLMQASFQQPAGGGGVQTAPAVQPMDNMDPNATGELPTPGNSFFPRELTMTSHPPRQVAPPDVLLIDAIRLVPKGPYRLEPLEVLQVNVSDTLPAQPIAGSFMISPEGTVNLGFNYGSVRVGGLTLDQAEVAIRKHLGGILKGPTVNLGVVQFRGIQQIRGEHLVRPDGTISLGMYGSVYVAGMNLGQVKCELEKYLAAYLVNPQLSVDMLSYNSQKYYVIFDGGGYGQQVFPLPITGNETVLDAISRVGGLAPVSSTCKIVLSRPSPTQMGCNQILPVDWQAILHGSTATNYQIFPGDRIYVPANCLIAFDNRLAQVINPIQRVLGVLLLGTTTVNSFRNNGNGSTGTGFFLGGVR
jgi:polysaccharide export outer membrane protein